jgi:hypothetical protein
MFFLYSTLRNNLITELFYLAHYNHLSHFPYHSRFPDIPLPPQAQSQSRKQINKHAPFYIHLPILFTFSLFVFLDDFLYYGSKKHNYTYCLLPTAP